MRTMRSWFAVCCVVAVFYLGVSLAGRGAQAPSGGPPATPPSTGSGPYKAVIEMDDWGNGACANTGNLFQPFLTEIASYGYLVIALGPVRELKAQPFTALPLRPQGANPPSPPLNLPPPATHPAQLIA